MTVSVIIPTYNRPQLLSTCLAQLCLQLSAGDEVIIVNNGHKSPTKNVVTSWKKKYPLVYFHEARRGPSWARNHGVARAHGEIIAFLDDDCLISPRWLTHIKQVVQRDAAKSFYTIYQGKIDHTFAASSTYSRLFFLQQEVAWRQIHQRHEWRKHQYIHFLNAGNFFLRRNILSSLDRVFDAQLFPYVGEERDLAYRLQLHGHHIVYCAAVAVAHQKISPTLIHSLVVSFRYGRTQGILEAKYAPRARVTRLFPQQTKTPDYWDLPNIGKILKGVNTQENPMLRLRLVLLFVVKAIVFAAGKLYGRILWNSVYINRHSNNEKGLI